MNKGNRYSLAKAVALIEEAREIISAVADEEQEKFDNLSEGLQQSENGQKFEENSSTLNEVLQSLEESIDNINTASE